MRLAGWPRRSLAIAWAVYAVAILFAIRFPLSARFLVPILVLAYVAPFVAGPERLARVLGGRRPEARGVVIDVTPRPFPGLPEPPDEVADGDVDDDDPGPAA